MCAEGLLAPSLSFKTRSLNETPWSGRAGKHALVHALRKPEPATHISRPSNAFTLFRSHTFRLNLFHEVLNSQTKKIIGAMWRTHGHEEKVVWNQLARDGEARATRAPLGLQPLAKTKKQDMGGLRS